MKQLAIAAALITAVAASPAGAQGIEIFTIGFDLTEKNAKSTLQACASPDTASIKHFYQAANGTELDQAFQSIVRNIDSLTVTK